jgi:LPXTG-site transpeptidase (sortase) family protein
MATIWPALSRAARGPSRLIGEVVGAGVLVAALFFTWSDGAPAADSLVVVLPPPVFAASVAAYSDPVHRRVLIPDAPMAPPRPVPTAAPAMILIPSLNVHRPVEAVGLDRTGAMEVTQNLWNAGWYKGGPVPGAPGDAVIEGHTGYPNAPLLFSKLNQLHPGDQIVIVLADGSKQLFRVDSMAIWPTGTTPTGMADPYGAPRLTLITCTGPFDDHYKTYADRLAVEASFAGVA